MKDVLEFYGGAARKIFGLVDVGLYRGVVVAGLNISGFWQELGATNREFWGSHML